MDEMRKSNKARFMTAVIGVVLVLSLISVLPVRADPPPVVEFRAGQNITGLGNVTMDDFVTPVPSGCLIEVINASNPMQIYDTFLIGDGTNGGPPLFPPLPGAFDAWPTVVSGQSVFLRAYNAPTVAGASLFGDSITVVIPGSGTYDFPGWALTQLKMVTAAANSTAGGNIELNTAGLPIINDYDLRNAMDHSSVLNMQLDVGSEYYYMVNITDLSGWTNINQVTITSWFDFGNEATTYNDPNHVPNTKFALQYRWGNVTNISLISTHTLSDMEIRDVYGPAPVIVDPSQTTFELYFFFTLGEQIRRAQGERTNWMDAAGVWMDPALAFNDNYSWNFDIEVLSNDTFEAHAYDEFGIYQYTSIAASDISAEGLPGQVVAFPELQLIYSSNDQYRLGVYLNNTLTKYWPTTTPNLTIGPQNLSVSGGWLLKTAFAGTGPAYTQYFYPDHGAPEWGTVSMLGVQFWVYIPLNVLGGSYRGDVVYMIEQI